MRDRGFNFFSYDKHRQPFYSDSFRTDEPTTLAPVVVTAFEVFEHLAEPAMELSEIFGLKPRLLLGTTERYSGQDDGWSYLSPFHGQHVFFYSQAELDWIANHFHYRYLCLPSLHAFVAQEVWENPKSQFEDGTRLGSPTFGVISNACDARIIQARLKLAHCSLHALVEWDGLVGVYFLPIEEKVECR